MGEKISGSHCPKCYTLNPQDLPSCSKCGTPLAKIAETLSLEDPQKAGPGGEPSPDLAPGSLFHNRFRIIEEIGRGGMGRVYKAEDTQLNITVALKIILARYSSNPRFVERFKKETLMARAIAHENVIRVFDLGEADRTKYISMEYIRGQNLRDLIRSSGSLSVQTVIHIARQLGEGLRAAHEKGIVHQDLKPSNIMIDNGGRAYIMDFGLARSFLSLEPGTGRGLSGTPPYMSPEQAKGEKADERSDIYSLGVMLYEMAAGEPPFKADTVEGYIRKHISEIPVPPSKLNPAIPASLEHIILRCLEKSEDKRYPDVRSLLDDLGHAELDLSGGKQARQKPRWILSMALFALLIAAGFALWKIRESGTTSGIKRKASLAIVYMANNTGNPELDWGRKAFSELLMTDLLQSKYIRVVTPNKLYETLQKLKLLEAKNYSSEDLERTARTSGVDHVLYGNYSMAGDMLRIDAILYRLGSLELVATEKVTGKGTDSIFAMVDELTKKIKAGLKLTPDEIRRDTDKDVQTITTSSPEALRDFIEGTRLHLASRFEESNRLLEKAVALDPEFALAYSRISDNYSYLGDTANSLKYLQKAMSLLNRVSEREYYLLQGNAAGNFSGRIENYQKLLALYPDDLEGNALLGAQYREMEEWDPALARFEKIADIDPGDSIAIENISYLERAKGRYDRAAAIVDSRRDIFPSLISVHVNLALAALCRRQFDLALAHAEEAASAGPEDLIALELLGHVRQTRGECGEARSAYTRLAGLGGNVPQSNGGVWLVSLDLIEGRIGRALEENRSAFETAQKNGNVIGLFNFSLLGADLGMTAGRMSEALDAANRAMELAYEIGDSEYKNLALHFRGLIHIRMNNIAEAETTARKLKMQIEESGVPKRMRHYEHLMGEIARSKGKLDEAVVHLRNAVSLLPHEFFKTDIHVIFLDSLASALFEKGETGEAEKVYQRITGLTTGRLRWGDRYVRSFYWLGGIRRKLGRLKESASCYEKFLDLWKNADAAVPELENARRELASLKK